MTNESSALNAGGAGSGSHRFAIRNLARLGVVLAIGILIALASNIAGADPASPLTVTKTDSVDPVASGAQLTYAISTVNTGGAKVSNVILTDQVNHLAGLGTPPQLVLTTTKGTCSQSFEQTYYLVTCNAGTLAGFSGFSVTIRGIVTAPGGTTINNTASVAATKTAQNFNTTATATTLVSGGPGPTLADLTINKAGPSTAVISTPMSPLYTLTVNNIGGANATDVTVVDTVPAGITGISATGNSLFVCGLAGQTVTCNGGRVNAGSNASIIISGTTPAAAGVIANTAVVDPNNTVQESNELNNTSATVTTNVTTGATAPKLAITKTDAPDPVTPGATLTYTIIVTNTGNGPQARADDVVMVDGTQGLEASTISASGFVGADPTDCQVNGFQVECSPSAPGRRLDGGQVMTITISGQVVASAGTNLINTATVTGNIKNQGVINSATATTEVKPAVDLTITKADSPDPVCARSWPGPGGVCQGGLTYTFVVGNSGTLPASGVVVRDELPTGMIFDSYVDVSGAGFICAIDPSDPKPNVVRCIGGIVPPESTVTITFLLVAPPTVGTVTNNVWVDPNNAIYEADETNNTFSINTQVITGIDLTILKCDEAGVAVEPVPLPLACPAGIPGFDPIATSGNLSYTLIVENIGTQDATNIRVRDFLPAGTIFRSVEGDNGFQCTYVSVSHYVECTQGELLGTESELYVPPVAAGYVPPVPGPQGPDQAKITIRAFAMPIVGTMHNESKVDPLHEIAEANESNNIEFEDTTVTIGDATIGAFNELIIDKAQTDPVPDGDGTIDSDDVATSGNLTYTITVQNTGTDPAVGVVVRDFLPAGAIFRQATADNGMLCGAFGGVVECVGGTLDGSSDLLPGIDDTAIITILVFAPPIPGIFANQAVVDPDNEIPEGNEFNNADSVNTQVAAGGVNAFNELTIVKAQTDPVPDVDTVVDAEDVATNGNLTYTITVGNTGSDPVTGVHVRDFLPEGARFRQATADNGFLCSEAGGVVNCVGGTLDSSTDMVPGVDDTAVITIKLFAPPIPGIVTNQSIVDPENAIPEGNEFNNASSVDTEVAVGGVNAFNELTVDKTDDILDGVDDHVTPGGLVTYTLVVANSGSDKAFFVKVRDFLPAGSTFVSAVDTAAGPGAFTCGQAAGVVDCINGTVNAGGARSIEITILAPTDIEPLVVNKSDIFIDMINQAKVDPDDEIPEGNETNNNDIEITRVKSDINLTITKNGPSNASQSTEEQYELHVENLGTVTAFGVEVVDALPVGLIPLNVTTSGTNFICQVLQNPVNVVECVGDLNAGQEVTIIITVFITLESGRLDNEACVDPDKKIQEFNEIDNCRTKTTVVTPGGTAENETLNPGSCSDLLDNDGDTLVDAADPGCIPPAPDISINKSADSGTGTPGQTLTYTLNVSNVGEAAAPTPVTVTDTLPSAVTFVNATGTNGFTCVFAAPDVTCTDPGSGLAIGGSTLITIQVTVDPKETGAGAGSCTDTIDNDGDTFIDEADPDCTLPFTNTATVATVTGETNTGNNTDSVLTSMGAAPTELAVISFEDLPDPINKGQTLEYTVIAVNGGTGDANGVEVLIEDVIPGGGGVTFVGAAGSNGFQCAFTTPDVTCTGNMPSGGFTIITIQVLPGASAPLSLTATATIDPSNAFPEVDESNNTMAQTTTVTGSICSSCIDLVMGSILDTPDPATPGGSAKLIVTAGNAGDLGTTGACVTPPCVLIRIVLPAPDLDYAVTYTATSGFTCADTNPAANIDIIDCVGELDAGEGVIITLDVDVTGASDVTVFTDAEIDPDDALIEGVGPFTEFTNANNATSEDTFIDVP